MADRYRKKVIEIEPGVRADVAAAIIHAVDRICRDAGATSSYDVPVVRGLSGGATGLYSGRVRNG